MGRNTFRQEVFQRIIERYDIEELIELLDLSTADIVTAFEDELMDMVYDLDVGLEEDYE